MTAIQQDTNGVFSKTEYVIVVDVCRQSFPPLVFGFVKYRDSGVVDVCSPSPVFRFSFREKALCSLKTLFVTQR